jgi:hypothetical protein
VCAKERNGYDSSRTNTDDRFSLDALGPVEGGNGIVEGSHVADVCPQTTIPDPLDELTQLAAIGYGCCCRRFSRRRLLDSVHGP